MGKKVQQKPLSKHAMKIISLFFAITLWFYVLNSSPIIIEKKIPINFKIPEGMAISNIIPREVTVKIKGSRVFMQNIFKKNEFVFINLNKLFKNKKELDIKIGVEDIPVPFGVEVLDMGPKSLTIKLQKLIKKTVRIVPVTIGEVGKEFKLIKKNMEPDRLMIQGPRGIIKDLKSISTSVIDISTLKESGRLQVIAVDVDPRLSMVNESPIYFNYEIRPRKANITLRNIKIRFLTSAKKIRPKFRMVSMDVLMPEGKDQNINSSLVEVLADIPDGVKGSVNIPLKAKLPPGVFLLKIDPEFVNIFVKP